MAVSCKHQVKLLFCDLRWFRPVLEKYGETLVACVLGGIVVVWGLGLYFFVDGLVIDPEDIEPVIDFNAFVSE